MGIKIQLFSNMNKKKRNNNQNNSFFGKIISGIIERLLAKFIFVALLLLIVWIFFPEVLSFIF